jgi:trehalose 6-phosphate phosphatase
VSMPLLEHLSAVAERLLAAPHWLLGLDYDGTLTPLAETPAAAILAFEMRELLQMFAGRIGLSTAIVSGRGLDDLRSMVGIDRLIYAGNHGCEISGPGIEFVDAVAAEKQEALAVLSELIIQSLQGIAGAFVENKELTLTIHYRLVAPELIPEVRRVVEKTLEADVHDFRLTRGTLAHEVRPPTKWNKGKAVDLIRRSACIRHPLTLYLGDDHTDEDAFEALHDDITVKVGGDPTTTKARYHLENPDRVATFLRWLERMSAK